jgi:hypothetical protein
VALSSRRTVVGEDWALVALVGRAGWGGDWSRFVVVDPDLLCGAFEPVGQHGDGGLPREPWIGAIEPERQTFAFPRLSPRRTPQVSVWERKRTAVEVIHPRCAGLDISKKDAKVCVRVAGAGRRKTVEMVTTWAQ